MPAAAGEGKEASVVALVALVALDAHGGGAETDEEREDGVHGPENRGGVSKGGEGV